MRVSVNARVFDPLWLLTRQWQVGEFQGEDAGTPVLGARARRERAAVALPSGRAAAEHARSGRRLRPAALPLEVMVERQRVRPAPADAPGDARKARARGRGRAALPAHAGAAAAVRTAIARRSSRASRCSARRRPRSRRSTPRPARFVETMAGRAPDGRRLRRGVPLGRRRRASHRPGAEDRRRRSRRGASRPARRWLAWYDTLFSEPRSRRRTPGCPSAWSTRSRWRRACPTTRSTSSR